MNKLKTVQVGNRNALLLAPEDDSQLAIVHLAVIQRLAELLPSVNFVAIKNRLRQQLDNCGDIIKYVELLKDEVAFHETVNLLSMYDPELVEPTTIELMLEQYIANLGNNQDLHWAVDSRTFMKYLVVVASTIGTGSKITVPVTELVDHQFLYVQESWYTEPVEAEHIAPNVHH